MASRLALSTRWNASRHSDGRALVDEILALGIDRIEIGYDLKGELHEGVLARIAEGAVTVTSVHNFCPVPPGASRPHPEIYTPGSADSRERAAAVKHIANTLRFAQKVGAGIVVVHCGNVDMPHFSYDLLDLVARGERNTSACEKLKMRLLDTRDRRIGPQLRGLEESLDALAPVLEETGVKMGLENLPTWESIPTELEAERLLKRYAKHGFRFWCDLGHTVVRENMGLINPVRWLDRLSPVLGGFHVHSVGFPGNDHLMPPKGDTDFARFARFVRADVPLVLEPAPGTPKEDIAAALPFLEEIWHLS